jgi:hypothetical protein
MLAAAIVAVGCGGGESSPSAPVQESADAIVELQGLQPIAERFEADRGKPRLLLILSPT